MLNNYIYDEKQADDRENNTDNSQSETSTNGIGSIDWDQDAVMDQGGETVIDSEDFPGSVRLSDESEFGVAGNITDASLSPDNTSIALTMSGAAHGSAWLYEIENEQMNPVGFQYGGGIELVEWSPNGQFLTLQMSSPAGTDLLKVVDRNNVQGSPDNVGFVIEVSEEAQLTPPYSYEFEEWQDARTLCFTFQGNDRCINVETREFTAN